MVADENNGEQETTHKAKKFPDRQWNISVKKNIKNKAKLTSGIQTRQKQLAKFGANPTKILGGVRITEVGGGPFDVNNGQAHLGILVYRDNPML